MNVEVFLTPSELTPARVRNKDVVVLDVLRASSTLVQAFAAGVTEVWPEATVADTLARATRLPPGSFLLGGERGGRRLPGFDLGNSPQDYAPERVGGKTLVFTTTNGTRTLARTRGARNVLVGCFRNLAAVAARLRAQGAVDVALLCAGQKGRLSYEDLGCAGALLERLTADGRTARIVDNSGMVARALIEAHPEPLDLLRRSTHGRRLMELGFAGDLEFCSRVDVADVVPHLATDRLLA